MSTSTTGTPVDLAPNPDAKPGLALALALISIPGVTIAWDIGVAVGLVGTAIGVTAVVLGLQSRARLSGAKGTTMATAAVVIAGLGLLSVVLFLAIGAPD
jgi:hypothetical protein